MDALLITKLRQIADFLENQNRGPTPNATACRNAAQEIESLSLRVEQEAAAAQRLRDELARLTDRMIVAGLLS